MKSLKKKFGKFAVSPSKMETLKGGGRITCDEDKPIQCCCPSLHEPCFVPAWCGM